MCCSNLDNLGECTIMNLTSHLQSLTLWTGEKLYVFLRYNMFFTEKREKKNVRSEKEGRKCSIISHFLYYKQSNKSKHENFRPISIDYLLNTIVLTGFVQSCREAHRTKKYSAYFYILISPSKHQTRGCRKRLEGNLEKRNFKKTHVKWMVARGILFLKIRKLYYCIRETQMQYCSVHSYYFNMDNTLP